VDAFGMPVRMFITSGTVAGCALAEQLIKGVNVDYVLADKGYDSDEIIALIKADVAEAVIPPRKNRKEQRLFDEDVYRMRCLVENAFLKLKKWRGIATRYAKTTKSFLVDVHIRCFAIWWGIS
jgi:transposase